MSNIKEERMNAINNESANAGDSVFQELIYLTQQEIELATMFFRIELEGQKDNVDCDLAEQCDKLKNSL